MSESLDKAARLIDLWFEAWTPGTDKLERWRELMGPEAPFNPDDLISRVRDLLREASDDFDSLVGEIDALEQRLYRARR